MVVIIKANRKCWQVSLIAERFWWEVAVWNTMRSALKGWYVERTVCGFRVVTPVVGIGICIAGRAK